MNYVDALSIFGQNKKLDLAEFEKTKEYMTLQFGSPSGSINKDFANMPVPIKLIIDGDVTNIIIKGKNQMFLMILYEIRTSLTSSERFAKVLVHDEEDKEWIRRNLLPNTRLRCEVTFNEELNTYNLKSILENDTSMKFGVYRCSDNDCGYKYGRHLDVRNKFCCVCGKPIKRIMNLYKEE